MRFRLTLLAIVAAIVLLLGAGLRAEETQRIAAVVNDEVISVYDLLSRIDLVVASTGLRNTPEVRGDIASRVLQTLIDERLELQEARRLGIEVSDGQMNAAVASMEQDGGAPAGSFFRFLDSNGINRDTALQQIRAQIAWGTAVRQRMGPNVVVGPEEVAAAVARIRAGRDQPAYRVAEILLVVPEADDETKVAGEAQNLVAQLRSGDVDFAALARQFSQSATAAVGGDLGWVQAGQLAPEIAAEVATLEPGQVSDPIRSVEGYNIVKLLDRQEPVAEDPGKTELDLVQVVLPVAEGADAAEDATQAGLAREVQATVRRCADMRQLAKVADNPFSGDLGTVRLADLPDPIRNAVATLPVEQPSAPVRTVNGWHVFMVCARRENGAPEIDEDSVRRDLLSRRLDRLARRYLRDLRTQAFIEVRV